MARAMVFAQRSRPALQPREFVDRDALRIKNIPLTCDEFAINRRHALHRPDDAVGTKPNAQRRAAQSFRLTPAPSPVLVVLDRPDLA